MALVREKRLPQLKLSLPVPPRASGQRPNPTFTPAPAPTGIRASTPTAMSSQFRLADFDKLAVLGRGNGGTVYKVCHRETSALYALKVQHCGDQAAATEAEILSRTASPFVVRCHSVLPSADGDVPMLLELVDGGSLDSIKSHQGAFSEAALAEVAAQALSGLAYLHARRIVHLDIKPANLLASTNGEVKVADFGIAKVLSRVGEQCTSYLGTTAYMSPERFDPEAHGGHYDPCAADVWSFGVTILELFMGRYPLLPAGQQPSWAALMCAVCFGEVPALPNGTASAELQSFVAACLHKDYRKRASVADLLAHPFVARRDISVSKCALQKLVTSASASLSLPECRHT